MAACDNRGERLIVSLIDSYAVDDPDRAWASLPKDGEDLTKGFVDVNYKQFANAINHAAWWLEKQFPGRAGSFETLAYAGPKDVRYPILAVAAVKCGKQLLLPSPFATPEAQMHLLKTTNCSAYLHAHTLGPLVDSVLGKKSNFRRLEVPELDEWLSKENAPVFSYTKTWEQAKLDPWLIFHTSGTTGLPKPVVYKNFMMASFDTAELMLDADQETMSDHFRNSRWYTPLPSLHIVGMIVALQWTIFLNTVLVIGPPGPTTAATVTQTLVFGDVAGAVLPPLLIKDLCRDAKGLDLLRRLDYVYFAGAPLSRPVAEQLLGYTKIHPAMGSTETGVHFIQVRNDDDWEYYCYHQSMGVDMEQRTGELYELVFHRKPELGRWQQLFHMYPTRDRFPTQDLWTKHPSKPNLWRYAGRADDMVKFSHGESLHAANLEEDIQKHPEVRTALIGGEGRPRPFLIIELSSSPKMSESERESKLDDIWPHIEKVNERCNEYVKLSKSRIVFTNPAKDLSRTAKGTISRKASIALYSSEIDVLYDN